MLVAVIGAQGVGKSTLLNEIAMLDYNVDNFKVSRTVQKELGFTDLSEIFYSFKTMRKFQEQVLYRKHLHDIRLKEDSDSDITFVERSFFDILAYTESHIDRLEDPSLPMKNWLDGYKTACMNYQDTIYDGIVLIEPNDNVPFEDDPARADFITQQAIGDRLRELVSFSSTPVLYLHSHCNKTRTNDVVNFVETLKK